MRRAVSPFWPALRASGKGRGRGEVRSCQLAGLSCGGVAVRVAPSERPGGGGVKGEAAAEG
jgi:hypothetical protein